MRLVNSKNQPVGGGDKIETPRGETFAVSDWAISDRKVYGRFVGVGGVMLQYVGRSAEDLGLRWIR